ncbi:MAG TPA: DUF2784 domain-containing protein [candidate division Zixibacteria bacterium]|nr:DUF2784 domain-containing protein [candidate division Zixibacteria bacterium]
MLKVMSEQSLVTLITVAHFLWVIFMLTGFFWTVLAFLIHRRFFDFFWLRTLHLMGIILVALFPLLGKYCPLTIWENVFRQRSGAGYQEGFMLHYIEKFIYPDVDPLAIRIGTFVVAFVSIAVYFLYPPEKTKRWLKKLSGAQGA